MRAPSPPRRLASAAASCVATIAALVFWHCTESPLPPEASFETAGLIDSNGVFIDTVLGEAFADMPIPFRTFYTYCSDCHSNLAQHAKAPEARAKMRINTWRDLVDFGPSRLVLAAKTGSMPIDSAPAVPRDVLNRAEAYLASWTTGKVEALSGCRYPLAADFVTRYCGECHTAQGRHASQSLAHKLLPLDTYAEWQSYQKVIEGRLSFTHPGGGIMPPKSHSLQPTTEERQAILDWLARKSPNTPGGLGEGDSLPIFPVVTEGAVRGLIYEPARLLINRSCADCHTQGGKNKDQAVGWGSAMRLDTYAQWRQYGPFIRERLDTAYALAQDPPLAVMPKYGFAYPLNRVERQLLIDWIDRGSPNTPDGMPNDTTPTLR